MAEWQNIVYSEYLPQILGPFGLQLLGEYHGYDPDINPTIANVFATAAYRFGHSQILPFFNRLDENYQPRPEGPLQLRHAFFAPFRLLEEGGIDPLLRGLVSSAAKKRAPHSGLNSNLTEALFEQVHTSRKPFPPLCVVLQTHPVIELCYHRHTTSVWTLQLSTSKEAGTMAFPPTSSGGSSAVSCVQLHTATFV